MKRTAHVSPPQYWLMKSEPSVFSITDLEKKHTHYWDGVRNYEARNMMRDQMQIGDLAIFYHSSAKPSGPAGVMKIVSHAYPDHTQYDAWSDAYEPKATKESPIWHMVDVEFVERFPSIIERGLLRNVPALSRMMLWKRNRLSITPLTGEEFKTIVRIGRKG